MQEEFKKYFNLLLANSRERVSIINPVRAHAHRMGRTT